MATKKLSAIEKIALIHKPEWQWLGRSLSNYQAMHEDLARDKKVYTAFMNARTLTQAKKILFGYKKKDFSAFRKSRHAEDET